MFVAIYPYLPDGRFFKFADLENPFMQAAALAREECAGDRLFPVGAVLVVDGQVAARAGNGYNRGAGFVHVCPRVVLECPSGTGYELCDLHGAPGHAEPMLIAAARRHGVDPKGADVYLYGHWWCCEQCWKVMLDAGVRDVYLLQDAHIAFDRERVYAQTLAPRVKRAYIAVAYTNNGGLEDNKSVYEAFGRVCEDLGCTAVIANQLNEDELRACDVLIANVSNPSLGIDVELALARTLEKPIVLISKKGSQVSNLALDYSSVVYHIQYDDTEQACRYLKNVLRQI